MSLNNKFSLKEISVFIFLFTIIFQTGFAQNDSSKRVLFRVNDIFIIGNSITKNSIILRELTFTKGSTIDSINLQQQLQRSKENIYNTSLFNSVEVNYFSFGDNEIKVTIFLKERWYLLPNPIFEIHERNFNVWWDESEKLHRVVIGGYLIYNNFRGRNETLSLAIKEDYFQRYDLKYDIPYINKKQQFGIGFSIGYNTNHEIIDNLVNNQLVYFLDDNFFALKEYYAEARITKRDGLYNTQTLYLDYKNDQINDTIVALNKDYFLNSRTNEQYVSISYLFEQDYRDIKIYPLKGYYFNFNFQQLGFVQKDLNISYIRASYKKFWELSDQFYFETGIDGRFSIQKSQPFFMQSALGWGTEYVRGYELYVINGQNYGLLKTEFKWQLFYPQVFHVPYFSWEKFNSIPIALYLTAFGDLGYAQDQLYANGNPLANTLLPGGGMGLDFVTYYNIVWRFEYSINKMGQRGFYVHFAAPI
jgi:outer membrane protein assembly factor BamA